MFASKMLKRIGVSKILAGLAGMAMTLAAGPGLAQDADTNGVRVDILQLAVEWQSAGIGNASFNPEDL
jgi:hypothetical protein